MKYFKTKWIVVLLISAFNICESFGQMNVTNTLMSSASYSTESPKISIANSFGEPFIFSSTSGIVYYNQGFHNSEINTLVATIDISEVKNEVTIYPNPVQNEIFIDSKTEFKKADIFSLEGLLIQSIYLRKNEPIEVMSLQNGLYIIQLISDINIKYSVLAEYRT